MSSISHRRRAREIRGFSLVELIVASTISGFVVLGILAVFVQGLRIYKYDSFRLEINHDIRGFTDELTSNATFANYFLIFSTFGGNLTTTTGNVTTVNNVTDGSSGDYLVLVNKDPADDTKVSSMIGYYRYVDASGNATLRKFTVNVSPSSNALVTSLLPAASTAGTHPLILPDSRAQGVGSGNTANIALASGSTAIFYNFYNRSVIVRGQIQYTAGDKLTKQAVSTYNFTVSPRG